MCWLIASPQVNANELTNGVINAAFMLLFKDSIRLFAAYNEGIINLLGKTDFTLNRLFVFSSVCGWSFNVFYFSPNREILRHEEDSV